MSDVIKDSGGIEVPISANLDQLKKGLEEIKRASDNPYKVKINAEMSFDSRRVAQEANKMIAVAERGMARRQAEAVARPMIERMAVERGMTMRGGGIMSAVRGAISGDGSIDPRGVVEGLGTEAATIGTAMAVTKAVGAGFAVANKAYDYMHARDRGSMREAMREDARKAVENIPLLGGPIKEVGGFWDRMGITDYFSPFGGQSTEKNNRMDEENRYQEGHIAQMAVQGNVKEIEKSRLAQQRAAAARAKGDERTAARIDASEYERTAVQDFAGVAEGKPSNAKAVAEGMIKASDERQAAALETIRVGGERVRRGADIMVAATSDATKAFLLQQENERKTLEENNKLALYGKVGEPLDAQKKANQQATSALQAEQQVALDKFVTDHRIAGEVSIAAVRSSNLRAQHENYKAEERDFKASWQARYDAEKDLTKKAEIKQEARAAYGAFQEDQRVAKEDVGTVLKARRESADLRGKGENLAAGERQKVAAMEIERRHADKEDLPALIDAQQHELMADRAQIMRPHDYFHESAPYSELPGGPGGDAVNETVDILKIIAEAVKEATAALKESQAHPQGAVLQ